MKPKHKRSIKQKELKPKEKPKVKQRKMKLKQIMKEIRNS